MWYIILFPLLPLTRYTSHAGFFTVEGEPEEPPLSQMSTSAEGNFDMLKRRKISVVRDPIVQRRPRREDMSAVY